jgi:hypothetical protein
LNSSVAYVLIEAACVVPDCCELWPSACIVCKRVA